MKKIECILFIDDSYPTNFYHQRLVESVECIDQAYDVRNGMEGLDYLQKKGNYNGSFPKPNIIFLDINMPKMNGFQFLEKFALLDEEIKNNILIIILTTSAWDTDKVKASKNNLIHDFLEKPLNKDSLEKICNYYKKTYLY